MSTRIEVEGFHLTVRDFRAIDDTAMLVSTWARNVARRGNRDAKTPPSAEEANVKKFASEMLKRADRNIFGPEHPIPPQVVQVLGRGVDTNFRSVERVGKHHLRRPIARDCNGSHAVDLVGPAPQHVGNSSAP